MKQKGQGLPLNVIVIAVLVLIVLIVMVAIFGGRMKLFGTGLEETTSYTKQCELPGTSRQCVKSTGDCTGDIISGSYKDCYDKFKEDHVCCEF